MNFSKFQLIYKPRIKKSHFDFSEEFNNRDNEDDINLDITNNVSVFISEDGCTAKVILDLWIFKDVDLEKVPFKINVVVEGEFSWKDMPDERLHLLLNQNAPAILYSYIRPILTSMTVEANMMPLVIPIMDFTKND